MAAAKSWLVVVLLLSSLALLTTIFLIAAPENSGFGDGVNLIYEASETSESGIEHNPTLSAGIIEHNSEKAQADVQARDPRKLAEVPPLPNELSPKTFTVAADPRKDLGEKGTLSVLFQKAGMEYFSGSGCPDYKHMMQKGVESMNSWDDYVKKFSSCPNTIFNTMPGLSDFLGAKSTFGETAFLCTQQFGLDACDFAPPAFELPNNFESWRMYASTKPDDQLWVIKPNAGYSSSGIEFGPASEVEKFKGSKDHTVQEYVSPPYTFLGHKYDLRQWSIVTSVNPLRVYINTDAYPKVATASFDPSLKKINDDCIHLTSPTKACDEAFLSKVPDRTNTDTWKNGIFGYGGTNDPTAWETTLQPSMFDAILRMYLAIYPRTVKLHDDLAKAGVSTDLMFGMGGCDVIFDNTGKAYVEEVNPNAFQLTGPNYNGGERYGNMYLLEMYRLGGGVAPERSTYESKLREAWDAFCIDRSGGCSPNQANIARRVVDEGMTSRFFRRVFPPPKGEITDSRIELLLGDVLPNDAFQMEWIQFLTSNYEKYKLLKY